MELIYKQNDNQLQLRESWKTAGGEAEIGEGLWATGRLWLPLASGWSSLSSGSVVVKLHYEPDPEHVGTSEADAPRSRLVPRVKDSKKGIGDDNDGADDGNDDRWCTASLNILFLFQFPNVPEHRHDRAESMARNKNQVFAAAAGCTYRKCFISHYAHVQYLTQHPGVTLNVTISVSFML